MKQDKLIEVHHQIKATTGYCTRYSRGPRGKLPRYLPGDANGVKVAGPQFDRRACNKLVALGWLEHFRDVAEDVTIYKAL